MMSNFSLKEAGSMGSLRKQLGRRNVVPKSRLFPDWLVHILIHALLIFSISATNFLHTHYVQTHVSFTMSTAELATSYAAIILADDGVDVTVSFPQPILYMSQKILIIA